MPLKYLYTHLLQTETSPLILQKGQTPPALVPTALSQLPWEQPRVVHVFAQNHVLRVPAPRTADVCVPRQVPPGSGEVEIPGQRNTRFSSISYSHSRLPGHPSRRGLQPDLSIPVGLVPGEAAGHPASTPSHLLYPFLRPTRLRLLPKWGFSLPAKARCPGTAAACGWDVTTPPKPATLQQLQRFPQRILELLLAVHEQMHHVIPCIKKANTVKKKYMLSPS